MVESPKATSALHKNTCTCTCEHVLHTYEQIHIPHLHKRKEGRACSLVVDICTLTEAPGSISSQYYKKIDFVLKRRSQCPGNSSRAQEKRP